MSDQANCVPKRRIESEKSMASTSQYYSHVTFEEELQNLRQRHLLYDVNEDDSKDEDYDSSEESTTQFEALPPDWEMVRHCSGIPVYVDQSTHVCTVSKPYFLGQRSPRSHDILMSSILCIAHKKALDEEKKGHSDIEKNQIKKMSDSVYTNEETEVTESRDIHKVESYNIEFSEDGDEPRCPINKSADSTKPVNLPGDTVMLPPRDNMIWTTEEFSSDQMNATAIRQVGNNQEIHGKATNCDLTMIVQGTSYLSAFHVLARQIRLQIPVFEFIQIASAWTLYEATAYVGDVKYGVGRGSNKRTAKYAAARDATQTLLLQMIDEHSIWKATNVLGCNYLIVFSELVKLILNQMPVYTFRQTASAQTPYEATAFVDGEKYGVGRGSKKRTAKHAAARDSVHILLLQMMEHVDLHVARPPAN